MSQLSRLSALSGSNTNEFLARSSRNRDNDGRATTLCTKCRGHDFLTTDTEAFKLKTLSKSEEHSLGLLAFNCYFDHGSIRVADDAIDSLVEACTFCALVLSAVKEQYDFIGKPLIGTERYRLLWRHIPYNFNRHANNDGRYARCLQVFSDANFDWTSGMVRDVIQRKHVRSLIAPVDFDGGEFLKARRVAEQVDYKLLRRQLDSCTEWHGNLCEEMTGKLKHKLPSSTYFTVVDVVDMCLVVPSNPIAYVALSYVWGGDGENSFLTKVDNVEELKVPGAFKARWAEIPATIQDAITVMQRLGERYLWVDSLCIIQDDPSSKQANIDSMTEVYTGALFTIVAATGQHAQSGLPGVRASSWPRAQRRAALGDGKEFALLDDVELLLDRAPWATRAWTFQEWALSSRCLIFLDGQVVFSCRYATWREDVVSEQYQPKEEIFSLNDVDFSYISIGYELRQFRRFYLQRDLQRDMGDVLMNTIHQYRKRKLTYEGDTLNAFQGVLADLALAMGSYTLMGTIARTLDWGILVQVSGTRRSRFPSWSWAGWVGFPQWVQEGDIFAWIYHHCWIVWHHRGWAASSITKVDRGQKVIDWHAGGEPPVDSSETDDWNSLPFAARVQWQTFKFARAIDATRAELPPDLPCDASIPEKLGLLQFWTYATKLRLGAAREGWAEVPFLDCDGIECGSVVLCTGRDSSSRPFDEHEVLLMSEANWAMGGSSYARHKDRKTARDRARQFVEGSLNVLLVSWNGPIAEKMGVGMIYQETLNFLGDYALEWKEVILA